MGIGGIAPPFLAWALDGGLWSASRSSLFTPGERTVSTHWVGWVRSRVSPNAVERENSLAPAGNRNPAVQSHKYM
jgi:hypothetical protein